MTLACTVLGGGSWGTALACQLAKGLGPEPERRFLTEIPIAASGGWQPGEQERLRLLLAEADARRSVS